MNVFSPAADTSALLFFYSYFNWSLVLLRGPLSLRRERYHVTWQMLFGEGFRCGVSGRIIDSDPKKTLFDSKAHILPSMADLLYQQDEDARLCFSVDSKLVLQIKRLRWKFRGNEKVEIDGVSVQISWDVYNWLFQSKSSGDGGGHAVFMFSFDSD